MTKTAIVVTNVSAGDASRLQGSTRTINSAINSRGNAASKAKRCDEIAVEAHAKAKPTPNKPDTPDQTNAEKRGRNGETSSNTGTH